MPRAFCSAVSLGCAIACSASPAPRRGPPKRRPSQRCPERPTPPAAAGHARQWRRSIRAPRRGVRSAAPTPWKVVGAIGWKARTFSGSLTTKALPITQKGSPLQDARPTATARMSQSGRVAITDLRVHKGRALHVNGCRRGLPPRPMPGAASST